MFKKGMILYFVGVDNGIITTHKVLEIMKERGERTVIALSEIKWKNRWNLCEDVIFLNPEPKNYWCSNTKVGNRKVCHLVFTSKEKAEQALFGYVLPQIIEQKQSKADDLLKQYQDIIVEIEKIDRRIQESKA